MKDLENSDSPVDFERLRDVCGDDAEMIDEIVELYFSQTSEQLVELEHAVSAKNFDDIYKSAHKIVGGSMTCGMNAVVPFMRELEQIGRSQNGENAAQLLQQAQTAFERMQSHLETNKNNLIS